LNGSNKDYFCTNKWVDVSNDNFGVTISPLESPLFEVGEMINEDNSAGSKIWKKDYENSSTIFSYAMNNYWHTNYKADQSGKTEFNFLISPHKKFRDIDAYQIGTEFQSPLIVIPVAANTAAEKSLFQLSSDAIMVSSITPKGKGIQIKLFNASNEKSKCRIIWDSIEPELVVKIFDGIKSQLNPEEEIEFLPFEVIQLIVNTK
jgi:alpha-mannosidase